jgi:hypothetical protein
MAVTHAPAREVAPVAPSSTAPVGSPEAKPEQTLRRARHAPQGNRQSPARATRAATDDEILGLDSTGRSSVGAQDAVPGEDACRDDARPAIMPAEDGARGTDGEVSGTNSTSGEPLELTRGDSSAESENLRAAFDENPELRQAWQDAQAYRETFATPDDARAATALLADLDRIDALFFSHRPEDHAELARAVANLDPAAFASLAQAMNGLARSSASNPPSVEAQHAAPSANAWRDAAHSAPAREDVPPTGRHTKDQRADSATGFTGDHLAKDDRRAQHAAPLQPHQPTQAQAEFFHAANAAAVEGVLDAIESQVERLLPEGVSKSARNRVVGEIYRELDATLRSNRQLTQQVRDAFRLASSDANASGGFDADHQRAVVSLVTGRARQALPAVAKRVLNEWTSTVVAANHDRRTRQRTAERRVDIGGSGGAGNDSARPMTARDINYARMSDSDILNL